MPILRRRLKCFYCGHKSALKESDSKRKWHCTNCDSDNYLDENGQITDPPVPNTPQQSQNYVSQTGSFGYPDLSQQNDIFCSTCVNNQNIFVQAVANYFPDDVDDRTYAEYEAQFPRWKAEMEKRYPQVCANCAPLVNNRIQSMTYLTRAENLKINLQKSRDGAKNLPQKQPHFWRDLVVRIAGISWFGSVLFQIIWHVLGIMSQDQTEGIVAYPQCILQSIENQATNVYCLDRVASMMPVILISGLLASWWNPKLLTASHSAGRLYGQKDFYALQTMFLIARLVGYIVLTKKVKRDNQELHRRIHGFLLVFLSICSFASLWIVKFQKRVVLSDYKTKLVEVPPAPNTPSVPAKPTTFQKSTAETSFPVSALAPPDFLKPSRFPDPPASTTSRRTSISNSATTLSLFDNNHDDDTSEMDWTPTGPSTGFTPRTHINSLAALSSVTPQGSPFRGSLPSAPIHPLHKASKPAPQPTFFRAPEEKRVEFSKSMLGKSGNKFGLDERGGQRAEMEIAPPRLAMQQEDTGLENLFSSVFSLSDEPKGIPALLAEQPAVSNGGQRWIGIAFWTVIIAGVCSLAMSWWFMKTPSQSSVIDSMEIGSGLDA